MVPRIDAFAEGSSAPPVQYQSAVETFEYEQFTGNDATQTPTRMQHVNTPPPTDQEQVLAQLTNLEQEWTVANINADKKKLDRNTR